MADEGNVHGHICWFEVPVMSMPRASAFYSSVLGWECDDMEGRPSPAGGGSIHMFKKDGFHGAFLQLNEDAIAKVADPNLLEKCAPLATFMVGNIEETLNKIEAAGGKRHIPKTEIGGGMGVFARFIDTEGNLLGIWAKE